MSCRIASCNNLFRPWYILVATCLQTYLFYAGVSRYITFREHVFDMKFGGNWNLGPMHFSLVTLIAAAIFFILFLYTSLTRTSNLANEGLNFGKEHVYATHFAWVPQDRVPGLEGSKISGNLYATANGMLGRGDLSGGLGGDEDGGGMTLSGIPYDTWSARSAPLPSEFGGAPSYQPVPPSFPNGGSASAVASGPDIKRGWNRGLWMMWRNFKQNSLPSSYIMHLLAAYAFYLAISPQQSQLIKRYALFSDKIWTHDLSMIIPATIGQPNSSESSVLAYPMSVEFFNLLFAYMTIAMRYPSVFWKANHSFTILFCFLLILVGVQSVVEASTASVLVKVCWNLPSSGLRFAGLCVLPDTRPSDQTTQSQSVDPLMDWEVQQNMVSLILSTCSSLLMIFLSTAVFVYGTHQFVDKTGFNSNLNYNLHRNMIMDRGTPPPLEATSDGASSQVGWTGCKGSTDYPQGTADSRSFFCHILAIIGSLCVLAMKIPILIACVYLYREQSALLMLINLLITGFLFCTWFIYWFAFCLKPAWELKVTYFPSYHHQGGVTMTQCPSRGTVLRGMRWNGGAISLRDGLLPTAGGAVGMLGVVNGDTSTQRRLSSGSPLYGCFHTENDGLCHLPTTSQPPASGIMGDSLNPLNSVGPRTGPQSVDCCSEDTEEGSRQSGTNNYVCLQSALDDNSNALSVIGTSLRRNTSLMSPQTAPNSQPQLPCSSSNFSLRRSTAADGQLAGGSTFDQSASELERSIGMLKYALRPSDVFSSTSVQCMSSFAQANNGVTASLPRAMTSEQAGAFHLSQTPASNEGSKPKTVVTSNGPRVTFKEETSPVTSEPGSNPISSNDSGIDNQGTVLMKNHLEKGDVALSSRFSTLPSASHSGVHLTFPSDLEHTSEHIYYNQDQFPLPGHERASHSAETTSKRTFSFSECPSMPPLNLPQNAAGEVSFVSLSRLYALGGPVQMNSTSPSENLMTRSAVIRDSDDRSSRLCSQV